MQKVDVNVISKLLYFFSREFVEMEMQNVLETNKLFTKNSQQYVIHYLRCSMILENVPLQKATKLCPDLPILVIAYSDGMVKARCCVPEVSFILNTVTTFFTCTFLETENKRLQCGKLVARVSEQNF